jgi:DNA-binding transcriptional LysR family regulator
MDSIEDLDTFLALAEAGHMGHAAAALGLTQPALSTRLRKLEQRLGMRLFERQASGMRLSEAGRELLEHARHTRASMHRLQERAQGVRAGDMKVVRIGMTLLAAVSRVPLLLRQVEEKAPALRLVLHEAFSSPMEQLVAEGEVDMAFVHPPIARQDLTCRTLFSEPMMLSVPAGWTVPTRADERLQWLRAQRIYWVGPRIGPDLHRRVAAWMDRAGVRCAANAEVSSYVIAQSFVAAAAGVALVPASVARLHANQVRALPLEGRPPELAFGLVRGRRTHARVYELICEAAAGSSG